LNKQIAVKKKPKGDKKTSPLEEKVQEQKKNIKGDSSDYHTIGDETHKNSVLQYRLSLPIDIKDDELELQQMLQDESSCPTLKNDNKVIVILQLPSGAVVEHFKVDKSGMELSVGIKLHKLMWHPRAIHLATRSDNPSVNADVGSKRDVIRETALITAIQAHDQTLGSSISNREQLITIPLLEKVFREKEMISYTTHSYQSSTINQMQLSFAYFEFETYKASNIEATPEKYLVEQEDFKFFGASKNQQEGHAGHNDSSKSTTSSASAATGSASAATGSASSSTANKGGSASAAIGLTSSAATGVPSALDKDTTTSSTSSASNTKSSSGCDADMESLSSSHNRDDDKEATPQDKDEASASYEAAEQAYSRMQEMKEEMNRMRKLHEKSVKDLEKANLKLAKNKKSLSNKNQKSQSYLETIQKLNQENEELKHDIDQRNNADNDRMTMALIAQEREDHCDAHRKTKKSRNETSSNTGHSHDIQLPPGGINDNVTVSTNLSDGDTNDL
jgi:hypothetical protein